MKCPLLTIALGPLAAKEAVEMGDCIKEECAWWDSDVEQCCIETIALSLSGILGYLSEIENKIPHEKQFRR